MNITKLEFYLLIINILAFIIAAINSKIPSKKPDGRRYIIVAIASIAGGSIGSLLSLLIFDRKAEKGNMLSRVIISCLVVIQAIIYLIFKGFIANQITFAFWRILVKYPISFIYLALINIITFLFYLKDKKAAEKGKNRVKIVTLLFLSFIGGSLGALLGMYGLRHKTNKSYFTIGIPLMIIMQIFTLFYLSNIWLVNISNYRSSLSWILL